MIELSGSFTVISPGTALIGHNYEKHDLVLH
jgi:ribonuclease I